MQTWLLLGEPSLACQPVEKRPRWPSRTAPTMLPSATDLVANGNRRAQGCCLCQFLRSALPEGEQPLHILTRGNQQRFYVHLLEPSQAEPSHPVPVLGLGVQRLHPNPPLAQSFLVGEGSAVGADPIDVSLVEVAEHLAAGLVVRALGPQFARLTRAGFRLVECQLPCLVFRPGEQALPGRATVEVARGVVGELLLAEEGMGL